jgi:hypothetical protein
MLHVAHLVTVGNGVHTLAPKVESTFRPTQFLVFVAAIGLIGLLSRLLGAVVSALAAMIAAVAALGSAAFIAIGAVVLFLVAMGLDGASGLGG